MRAVDVIIEDIKQNPNNWTIDAYRLTNKVNNTSALLLLIGGRVVITNKRKEVANGRVTEISHYRDR